MSSEDIHRSDRERAEGVHAGLKLNTQHHIPGTSPNTYPTRPSPVSEMSAPTDQTHDTDRAKAIADALASLDYDGIAAFDATEPEYGFLETTYAEFDDPAYVKLLATTTTAADSCRASTASFERERGSDRSATSVSSTSSETSHWDSTPFPVGCWRRNESGLSSITMPLSPV
ncbi:hypothetical protein ACKVMT_17445 [Halobacteriales archaeon Cl-PHB]